jgi:hypothetical protein
MGPTEQSLISLAESLLQAAKDYDAKADDDRSLRWKMAKTAQDIQMQLKDPKEATFDHLSNVCTMALASSPKHDFRIQNTAPSIELLY